MRSGSATKASGFAAKASADLTYERLGEDEALTSVRLGEATAEEDDGEGSALDKPFFENLCEREALLSPFAILGNIAPCAQVRTHPRWMCPEGARREDPLVGRFKER